MAVGRLSPSSPQDTGLPPEEPVLFGTDIADAGESFAVAADPGRIVCVQERPDFLRALTCQDQWRGQAEDAADDVIATAISCRASDIDLVPGHPPYMHSPSGLRPAGRPMGQNDVLAVIGAMLLSESGVEADGAEGLWQRRVARLEERMRTHCEHDFGATRKVRGDTLRLRVHVALSEWGMGATIRLLPMVVPAVGSLGFSDDVIQKVLDILAQKTGFGLVTGPTGSGKSTTIAAILNHVRVTAAKKIVTIEDPIEFLYQNGAGARSLVLQQEVGRDVPSFADGLRSALRQRPDIILLGEIRDLESMEVCMAAVQTGHFILATLHTRGVASTLERILEFFSSDHSSHVLRACSRSLHFILSQGLLPHAGGDRRVLAYEFFRNNETASVQAIRQFLEQPNALMDFMRRPHSVLWSSCVDRLSESGQITDETARRYLGEQA